MRDADNSAGECEQYHPFLNLNEVQAFNASGALLVPVSANLSTTHSPEFQASNCIDGVISSKTESQCHTYCDDPDPWLRIDYGKDVAIAAVVVYNRIHGGQDVLQRIDGATVSISVSENGTNPSWSDNILGVHRTYTFGMLFLSACACASARVWLDNQHVACWGGLPSTGKYTACKHPTRRTLSGFASPCFTLFMLHTLLNE